MRIDLDCSGQSLELQDTKPINRLWLEGLKKNCIRMKWPAARCIKRLRCNVFLSLCRRNEMLLANKPTIVRQAAATAGPEEEKIKKFATAIVEFSKVKSD